MADNGNYKQWQWAVWVFKLKNLCLLFFGMDFAVFVCLDQTAHVFFVCFFNPQRRQHGRNFSRKFIKFLHSKTFVRYMCLCKLPCSTVHTRDRRLVFVFLRSVQKKKSTPLGLLLASNQQPQVMKISCSSLWTFCRLLEKVDLWPSKDLLA